MTAIAAQLADLLSTAQRSGDFYTSGMVELLAPSLHIEGIGPVALPLLPAQAEQIAAVAQLAPYGRGEATLHDTTVRRTWQIGPDKVQIQGRHWPRTLEAILTRVAEGLGVDDPVEAEFYKLLLYDTGCFFVSHRDTEKAPGMFATLVIVLPSRCSGGELVVRHQDREARMDLRCEDPAEASFAAFYADCLHEVLPVSAGHRIAMVYNLVRRGRGKPPGPPEYSREQSRLTALLQRWCDRAAPKDDAAPVKLVYLLQHAYTPAELGFQALKGADAAAAKVLTGAVRQSGCELRLALLTREASGSAEYHGYSRRRSRHDDDDDDDDDDEFEIGEVFDESVMLSAWRSLEDSPAEFGEIPVQPNELSPPEYFDQLEPDEIHFSEATGNEGASFESSYRRAALVLWPHDNVFAVISQAGLAVTLPYLEDMARNWRSQGAEGASPMRLDAHELAGHMVAGWLTAQRFPRHDETTTSVTRMLAALTLLDDTEAIENFVTRVIAAGVFGTSDNPGMLAALSLLPRETSLGLIEKVIAATGTTRFAACADLLARAAAASLERADSLRGAAAGLVEVLPGGLPRKPDTIWRPEPAVEPGCVVDLLFALGTIDGALAERAVAHMLASPQLYGEDTVLLPAMKSLQTTSVREVSALRRLHEVCVDHLRARIAEPLAPPADWRRPSRVGCNCVFCSELSMFLADPTRKAWTLRSAQPNRTHVEHTIRTATCDIDTVTERRGSPHSLICTKNQASYERRATQRAVDIKDLQVLAPAPS